MSTEQVLLVLAKQAGLLCYGIPLSDGKLECFREALRMESFPAIVLEVKTILEQDLFSTVEEVEAMEQGFRNHEGSELVVQCCLIIELCSRTIFEDGDEIPTYNPLLFAQCRSLEELAHLRFRLSFVKQTSPFSIKLELTMLDRAHDLVRSTRATWPGMLLMFTVGARRSMFRLFALCSAQLADEVMDMPKSAATLLLSYIADLIPWWKCPKVAKVIMKLLKLGASPMVSHDGHATLFGRIHAQNYLGQGDPWWLRTTALEPKTLGRSPTAMSRMLGKSWSAEIKKELSEHACCSLDAGVAVYELYPMKLPRLACLAARKVKESELATLPAYMRFEVLSHQPKQEWFEPRLHMSNN